jgi:hypothetical protein
MTIQNSKQTAQQAITNFKSFLGKKREELPWLNGKTKGFPNRVHGFYDCALGYSYISGLRPVQVSCTAVKNLAIHNKVWNLDIKKVLPGDAVLFDWETGKAPGKNNNTDHIGMVISVDVKNKTVTYVSADTGKVIPGIVTINTVGIKWVAGFARIVNFADPVSHKPDVHAGQREVHSATAAPANVVPDTAPVLPTLADAHNGATPKTAPKPAPKPVAKPVVPAPAPAKKPTATGSASMKVTE